LASFHLASPSLRTKVSVSPKSPSAQPHRYASLADSDSERVAEAERGTTSDPQPGHHRTPSARCRISGWPHSQAWLPMASGKEAICSRVSSICLLMGRSHLVQRAAPSVPRSSSLIPQQGQIMELILDDVWVCFFTVFPLARLVRGSVINSCLNRSFFYSPFSILLRFPPVRCLWV
jgi:hypothetical protein